MRIAFLTEHYAPKVDGVVTRLQHTLHHLKKKNIEIIVLTGNNHVKKFEKRENDIHVIRLPSFSYPFYKEKKLALPTKKIEKILIEFKPHVIHVVNPSLLGVMGLKIGKKYQIPTLASQHSNYTAYLDYFHLKIFKNFSSQILVKFLNKADKVLCTSTSMHELLKKDGVQNIEVWLPGVATDEITPSLRNFEIKKTNEFLLIYVGRLAKEKNITLIKQALLNHPEIRFILVGNGPYKKKLSHYFAGTNTQFIDFLHGKDLAAMYANADALILPSCTETLGLVLLEGMAAGLPVLGAKAGGIPSIIEHDVNGFLFTPNSSESIAEAISRLLTMPAKNLNVIKKNARITAEKWSWENATDQLITFYQSLM